MYSESLVSRIAIGSKFKRSQEKQPTNEHENGLTPMQRHAELKIPVPTDSEKQC